MQKVVAVVTLAFYLCAAWLMANWTTDALGSPQDYPLKGLMRLSLLGCGFLLMAGICSFWNRNIASGLGLLGVFLIGPYFVRLGFALPWDNFSWLVRIHDRGKEQVMGVSGAAGAAIYAILFSTLVLWSSRRKGSKFRNSRSPDF